MGVKYKNTPHGDLVCVFGLKAMSKPSSWCGKTRNLVSFQISRHIYIHDSNFYDFKKMSHYTIINIIIVHDYVISKKIWKSFEIKLSNGNVGYIVLKMILGIAYSIDS